jgi:P27 family predicted phage terminase small subunit
MNGDRDMAGHRQLAPDLACERGVPGMPDWLSREAKAEWRRIAPDLDRVGMLCKVDRAALAAYCQAFAEMADAIRILEKEGRIIDQAVFNKNGDKTGSIKKIHPAHKLYKEGTARVKQFLGEFGLTPSSRTRLKGAAPGSGGGQEKEDEAEQFFGGGKNKKA